MSSAAPAIQPVDPLPSADQDGRAIALLAHLGTFLAGFLGPLVVYLVAERSSVHARQHAATAFNHSVTSFLVLLVLGILGLVITAAGMVLQLLEVDTPGVLLSTVLASIPMVLGLGWVLAGFIYKVQACIAASRGRPFTHPLALKLLS